MMSQIWGAGLSCEMAGYPMVSFSERLGLALAPIGLNGSKTYFSMISFGSDNYESHQN
ncbi:MAG: hypothetical protein HEP71_00670 [Roseivirga sp.]|nr:hypothetical protein [Roseivirga sp.]